MIRRCSNKRQRQYRDSLSYIVSDNISGAFHFLRYERSASLDLLYQVSRGSSDLDDLDLNPIIQTIDSSVGDYNIKKENPDTLVLLGDVKSSIQTITNSEWKDVPYFFEEIKNSLEIILIPGNHDSNIEKLIPNDITLIGSKGMIIDDVLLTHGHTMPSKNYSSVNNIIMGHIHPVYFDQSSLLNGERIWISIKADKSKIFPSTKGKINITIIPSFNPYF